MKKELLKLILYKNQIRHMHNGNSGNNSPNSPRREPDNPDKPSEFNEIYLEQIKKYREEARNLWSNFEEQHGEVPPLRPQVIDQFNALHDRLQAAESAVEEAIQRRRAAVESESTEIEQSQMLLDSLILSYRKALDRFDAYIHGMIPRFMMDTVGAIIIPGIKLILVTTVTGFTVYFSYRLVKYFVIGNSGAVGATITQSAQSAEANTLYLKTVTRPTFVGLLHKIWENVYSMFKKK